MSPRPPHPASPSGPTAGHLVAGAGSKAPAPEGSGRASEGTRLTAEEIHENVRKSAEEEMERPIRELAWSAVAAGLAISLSFVAAAYLSSLAEGPVGEALGAAGYPLGFILVVIARQQLFTENALHPVIPVLHHRSGDMLGRLLRLWAVVLVGNLVGTMLFGVAAARTPMFDAELHASLRRVAAHGTEGTFWFVAWRAVLAGWLVGLMAWLVASTRYTGAQVALVWLATAPIAALNFRHSIAGSAEAFYRASLGDATWGAMLGGFVVPSVLGNVVGGVLLVAVLNHAQVAPARATEEERKVITTS